MKKSQISIYIVFGTSILILAALLFLYLSENNSDFLVKEKESMFTQSYIKADIDGFITSCVEFSIKESIQDTGIREETVSEYKKLVSKEIKLKLQLLEKCFL